MTTQNGPNPHSPFRIPHSAIGSTPHLILGGAKSGKSAYAEALISCLPPPYFYVATATALDAEMEERVRRHQERRKSFWETIEMEFELMGTLRDLQGRGRPVLVDCLTLWLTNLLLSSAAVSPDEAVDQLCEFLTIADFPLFLVSNEVGGGIVPENSLARKFRDLAGSANQQVAGACRAVTLVVAGLPLALK